MTEFLLQKICNILETEMELDPDEERVYIYNQKKNIPTLPGVYIVVGVINPKAFGSASSFDNEVETQSVNMGGTLSIDIFSKDLTALNRKEEIVMALASIYSQKMQDKFSFHIGKLPTGFVNLSEIEGAAIPYRFNLTVGVQYKLQKQKNVDYYDDFSKSVITEA